MEFVEHFNITVVQLRLKHVANRLGLSSGSLRSFLKGVGFNMPGKRDIILQEEHLDALAKKYVESIHKLAFRTKARIKKKEVKSELFLKIFYPFLKDSSEEVFILSSYETWELDDKKIEAAFFLHIYNSRIRKDRGNKFCRGILRLICSHIDVPIIDIKSLILSKISPTLFFSYPGEDDHHKTAYSKIGLGVGNFFFTLQVFANYIINYTKNVLSDEKERLFKTTYNRVRFTC